jgi:hypothetical protein
MPIHKASQYIFWCDTCLACRSVDFVHTKKQAIKEARLNGWSIKENGDCFCFECKKKFKDGE